MISLHLDQPFKSYGPKSADCSNWTGFRHFILWAKDDQPNGLQIMRGWSCWKAYFSILNKGKVFIGIAHYCLQEQTYNTGHTFGQTGHEKGAVI